MTNIETPQCSHCGSQNLSPIHTEDFPINGNDDPQYGGGWETVQQRDCLECGEAGVWQNKPYHLPVKFLVNEAAWEVWVELISVEYPNKPESYPCFATINKADGWDVLEELEVAYLYADDVATMILSLEQRS